MTVQVSKQHSNEAGAHASQSPQRPAAADNDNMPVVSSTRADGLRANRATQLGAIAREVRTVLDSVPRLDSSKALHLPPRPVLQLSTSSSVSSGPGSSPRTPWSPAWSPSPESAHAAVFPIGSAAVAQRPDLTSPERAARAKRRAQRASLANRRFSLGDGESAAAPVLQQQGSSGLVAIHPTCGSPGQCRGAGSSEGGGGLSRLRRAYHRVREAISEGELKVLELQAQIIEIEVTLLKRKHAKDVSDPGYASRLGRAKRVNVERRRSTGD